MKEVQSTPQRLPDNTEGDNTTSGTPDAGTAGTETKPEGQPAPATAPAPAPNGVPATATTTDPATTTTGDQKPEGAEGTEGAEGEGAEGDQEDPLAFWGEIDKLRGEPLEVDYGSSVPNTPEWVLKRENALRDKAIDDYDEFLRAKDARSYAYMLHRDKGGSDEEFFAIKVPALPDPEELKNSVDLQTSLYRRDLLNSGVDPEDAEVLVKKAVADGHIAKKAEAVYRKSEETATKQLEKVQDELDAKDEAFNSKLKEVAVTIKTAITSPALGYAVPENIQGPFTEYVTSTIRHENGKFFSVQEITPTTVNKVVEALLFSYKGGDLNALVRRKTGTMFVGAIKKKADEATSARKSTGQAPASQGTMRELREYMRADKGG